jgi:nucleotide-binding universal stress UspA family protein
MHATLDPSSTSPILVPVDFSHQSRAAALTASALTGQSPVPVLLLHVAHENSQQPGFYRRHSNGMSNITKPLADIAQELLDQFLQELRFDHPEASGLRQARTMTVTGLPSKRIVEVAERENAMMIVMGSRGRTGLPHWLLGSVAEQVSRHSPRPVTIIKDAEFHERHRVGLQTLHSRCDESVADPAAILRPL